MKEICSKYLADGSALIGQNITFEGWTEEQESTEGAEKPEPTMAQSSPSKAVATLSDLQDPVWIAQQAGFSVGTLVVQKSVEASTEGWYTIFSWRRSSAASGGQLQWPACQGFYLPECSADGVAAKQGGSPHADARGETRPESLDVDLYKSLLFQALLAADVKNFDKHTLSLLEEA